MITDLGMQKGWIDIYNPPVNFITPFAQEVIAIGIFMFFVCWGISKIIKAAKK